MKTLSLLTALAILVTPFAFSAGSSEQGQDGQMTIRYAERNPQGDSITIAGEEFARIVEERTDGRIVIDVQPGGVLGGHDEIITGLQTGAIGMGRTQYGYLADAGWERLAVFSLPFIWRDVEHARDVLNGDVGQETLSALEDELGIVGLTHLVTYPRNFFFTDTRVTGLEDIEGMKLRVQPGELYVNMVEGLGAEPIAIDFGELYTSLQSGVVDGAEQPPKGYVANNFYEITDYYVLTRHQIDPSVMLVSPSVWEQLSEADRQIFREAAVEAQAHYVEVATDENQEAFDRIEEEGVEILEVDNQQAWQNAVSGIYDQYGDYEDLIQAIINN